MMRSGLQSSIIVFGAFATWHLASAGFGLSPELIIEIASTKLNYNPETLDSLVSQRADTLVGVTLFLTTVLMQVVHMALPTRIKDLGVSWSGVMAGVAFSAVVGAASFWWVGHIEDETRVEIEAKMKKDPPVTTYEGAK